MDAICKVSSSTGLGFAICAFLWRSKYPACKAALLPSVITIVAFAIGTFCGIAASTCWLEFADAPALPTLRNAGINTLLYSPLYVAVLSSKVELLARHMLMTVFVVTIIAAGILAGSYLFYRDASQAAEFNACILIVCLAINLLGVVVGLQKADFGALFGIIIDILLFGFMGLSFQGLISDRELLCVPFLTLSALILAPCSWFTCRMAIGCYRTLPQLLDKQTGVMLVPQPKTGPRQNVESDGIELEELKDPILDTRSVGRPPITFPAMPCKPPTEEFLSQTCHLFVIPNYNESLDLLESTLRVLTTHPGCQQRYAVLLAMEASEHGVADKAYLLEEKYRGTFRWIGHTVHQIRAGELAGKGSNLNSAVQQLMQLEWASAKPESIMLTVMDADTILPAEYIAGLDWVWASNPKAVSTALLCPTTPLIANSRETSFLVRAWELIYFTCINGQMGHAGALRMPLACYSMLLSVPDEVGYWEPGLSGIAEDQHTALRCYMHFTRKGSKGHVIAILAPYWGQCEPSFRLKAKQQVRHFFGLQDMWFALARSQGLCLRDRLHVFFTVASPILMAVACPVATLGANLLFTYGTSFDLRLWAFLISALGLPQAPAAVALLFYAQYVWAFSEGVSAYEKRGVFQVLKLASVFPALFVIQYVCSMYCKLWLLTAEMGLTRIVYEGARQGAARPASAV